MRARTMGVLATGALATGVAGCSMIPKAEPGGFADRSGVAAGAAMDQTYSGFGDAAQAPLRDLNVIREQAPPVLVRAYARPYDQSGLDTCPAIAEQVHMLDLALGPDVDIPLGESAEKDMFAKGASFAADAALDAVRSATTGVIPVRSWVRRFSGANRAEQDAKAVALAGSVRRGYLKALGQMRGCDWPAAPLRSSSVQAKLSSEATPAAPGTLDTGKTPPKAKPEN